MIRQIPVEQGKAGEAWVGRTGERDKMWVEGEQVDARGLVSEIILLGCNSTKGWEGERISCNYKAEDKALHKYPTYILLWSGPDMW